MNGSLTPASREREAPVVAVVHDRRWVVAYSYGLVAAAVAVAVGAALGGSPFPQWWPLLVFALSMWFTANRFAFFPSEFAVTAEPAVVFVAVVGFAGDAWILGPMIVAMLVGPLDRRFWEQRAFVRMAYNTGWQGLAAAVAAVTFRGATAALGSSGAATVAAILLAAVPYFAFDSLMAAVLVALRREPDVGAMVRHIVVLNTVEFPFAAYAGVVGFLALAHGWWLALVLLAPLPGLPELLFVRVRRSWTTSGRQSVARVALLVAVVAGTAALSPWSRVGELAVLFALAIALGAELRATPVAPVAPLTMLVVSTTACASAGAGVPEASVAVALVALLVSWSPERRLPWRAVIVAIAAGAATATLVDSVYGSSTASLVGAGFAGTTVGLTLVVAASSATRRAVAGRGRGRVVRSSLRGGDARGCGVAARVGRGSLRGGGPRPLRGRRCGVLGLAAVAEPHRREGDRARVEVGARRVRGRRRRGGGGRVQCGSGRGTRLGDARPVGGGGRGCRAGDGGVRGSAVAPGAPWPTAGCAAARRGRRGDQRRVRAVGSRRPGRGAGRAARRDRGRWRDRGEAPPDASEGSHAASDGHPPASRRDHRSLELASRSILIR